MSIRTVQQDLRDAGYDPGPIDGAWGTRTHDALKKALADARSARPSTAKPTLTEADFQRAAATLGVDVASIKAVTEVEAPRGGFYADGSPTILFERHIFSRETGGRYDRTHPAISNRSPGGYGASSAQHGRLTQAVALDRTAALRSASWGKFQIMGFNHTAAGFPTVQAFVNAMYQSEGAQLDAFVNFIRSNPGMHNALRQKNWATFARLYNGPNYAINDYDTKLAAAYKRFS